MNALLEALALWVIGLLFVSWLIACAAIPQLFLLTVLIIIIPYAIRVLLREVAEWLEAHTQDS